MAYCSTCGECHYVGKCPLYDTRGGENKMTNDLLPCPFEKWQVWANPDDEIMMVVSVRYSDSGEGYKVEYVTEHGEKGSFWDNDRSIIDNIRQIDTSTPNKPAEVDLDAAIQLVRSGFIVRENIGDLQFDKYAKALELIISRATGKGGGEPAAPTQIDAGESEAALDNIAAVELIAKWMIHHGFTTGRGGTIEGLLNELSWQIAEIKTEGDDGGHATEQQPAAPAQIDAGDIVGRLKDACIGAPYAKIPWPHRLLHDAISEIEQLRAARAHLEKSKGGV